MAEVVLLAEFSRAIKLKNEVVIKNGNKNLLR